MTEPTALGATTVYVSGDDDAAKTVIKSSLTDLGWPEANQLDLGCIATAVGPEHYIRLFFAMFQVVGKPMFNINVVRCEHGRSVRGSDSRRTCAPVPYRPTGESPQPAGANPIQKVSVCGNCFALVAAVSPASGDILRLSY